MHPARNNSPGPLWSVQDKGFIIDLRLIVTLWITRPRVRACVLPLPLPLHPLPRFHFPRIAGERERERAEAAPLSLAT